MGVCWCSCTWVLGGHVYKICLTFGIIFYITAERKSFVHKCPSVNGTCRIGHIAKHSWVNGKHGSFYPTVFLLLKDSNLGKGVWNYWNLKVHIDRKKSPTLRCNQRSKLAKSIVAYVSIIVNFQNPGFGNK